MPEKKQHRMMFEVIRKEPTEHWAISVTESVWIMKKISSLASKEWYECYLKSYPKGILGYEPTNKEYKIKTVEDIAKLSPEQFEMFLEDLRNWCDIQRWIDTLSSMWIDISNEEWMIRLDTGKHEEIIKVEANFTNKLG